MDNKLRTNNSDHDAFMIKAIGWFIVLCVVGCVACIILGTLKVAIQAMVVAAAVLMFIALLGWVAYEKTRNRIEGYKQRHDSDSQQE